jgi:hypothetical protein
MVGCGVCAGTLRRWLWLSDVLLAGLIALSAGDCTSCLIPLVAGGDAAGFDCTAGRGGIVAAAPRAPLNGFAAGVDGLLDEDGRAAR